MKLSPSFVSKRTITYPRQLTQHRKLQHSHCYMHINNEVTGCTRLQDRGSNLTEVEIAKPSEITGYGIHLRQDYKKSSFTLQQLNSNFLLT